MAKPRISTKSSALTRAAELAEAGNFAEAERVYQQALRKQPNSAKAITGLATLYRNSGRFDEAIDQLRRGLRISPSHIDLHNQLCATLMMAGRDDQEIINAAEEAIRAAPQSPVGYFQLAQIYRRRYEPMAAIKVLEEGLEKCGADWFMRRMLAGAWGDYGDSAKAIQHYESVIHEDARDADVQIEYANQLRNAGRFNEAVSHYEQALRLRPNDPAATAGLADLYESSREYEKASHLVTQAIYSGVKHPEVVLAYARVARRSNNPAGAIPLLEELANDPRSIAPARARALMLLGALYEDQGQYDDAFARYQAGNQIQQGTFDPASIRNGVDGILATFQSGMMAHYPRSTTRDSAPVFIIGMPRTGTSLVEQILACHSEVHGAGERHAISSIGFELARRVPSNIGAYPKCVQGLTPELIDELSRDYLASLHAIAPEARYIIDKNPFNFLNLGFIALLAPGARVIHCTRDPMDTCFSIYATRLSAKNDYSNNLVHIAEFYKQYRRMMDHWRQTLDLPMIDVAYGDIVADVDSMTRRLLDFLDLPFEEQCVRFFESDRFTRTLSADQVRRPIYESSVGRSERFAKHLAPLREALAGVTN